MESLPLKKGSKVAKIQSCSQNENLTKTVHFAIPKYTPCIFVSEDSFNDIAAACSNEILPLGGGMGVENNINQY